MATPMLRELRRQLPRATIVAVVDEATAQVVSSNTDVDGLCVFRRGGDTGRLLWAGVRAVRRFRADVLLAPQTANTLKQVFLSFYSGAGVRVKHKFDYPPERRYSDFEFLFTHLPPLNPAQHRVFDNLALLPTIGLKSDAARPTAMFPVSAWNSERAMALLKSKGWRKNCPTVCMHPGVGTATLNKQWPADRFAALGRRLVVERGAQIVLVGGKGEVALCRQVARGMESGCIVVAGECSLAETAAVIRACGLFVSNDSGLMHLAAAVGARGLALFAKTDPVKTGPLGGYICVMQAQSMGDIALEDVYDKCVEMMPTELKGKPA
jgi:heptosyltransferase-2